jgi:hypothetical protein
MGALLVSMSADAFILLMPTGGVAPSCVPATIATGQAAAFSVATGTTFTVCP